MPEVRQATVEEIPEVGRILAAAFSDDPVWRWLASPRADWDGAAAKWFEVEAATNLAGHGPVLVDRDLTGAALWADPKRWRQDLREQARIAPASLRLFGRNTIRALRTASLIEGQHESEEHHYLAFLGTRPEAQGRGVGSALIRSVTDRCDEEGIGAYLESSKEANLAFYARHGFEVRKRIDTPGGGPPLWTMWRKPRGERA